MSIKIIEERLKEYAPTSQRDELNAIKEIVQEIALCALARSDFFKIAAFQGGSCLRIVHSLNRFSEDLDFILHEPDKSFVWDPFLKALQLEFKLYALEFQIIDRSKADNAIKMAFLKDNSFGKVLILKHSRSSSDKQTIQIKLEIDTNPPADSTFQSHFLNFPYPFSIIAQDLPSLFAGKIHALLCRPYVKGRDWFDFVWYVSKKVVPNYTHLQKAIEQVGPWQNQVVDMSKEWLISELKNKIETINWTEAKKDAENFLRIHERQGLEVWGNDFFLATVKKFAEYLSTSPK
jgi:predicted nucleotidyltransferase component of viral defense system